MKKHLLPNSFANGNHKNYNMRKEVAENNASHDDAVLVSGTEN